jgi:cysteine synthase
MKIFKNALELIGKTPLVELSKLSKDLNVTVLAKCEFLNPSSSVKDRAALAMIESAEAAGVLNTQTTIIEPTSGNTGIGIAFVAAVKGYKVILTMPESMSIERRKLLKALGADLKLTPAHLGMEGAINKAIELKDAIGNAFIPQQFTNAANPQTHQETTAEEIWNDTDGSVDVFVAGVGTGGTISGVSRGLKSKKESLISIAVEPKDSAVLSGGEPGPHMLQGIGAGFIPKNVDRSLIDEIITVSNEDAITMAQRIAKEEGLLVGISSGANVHAALEIAARPEFEGKTIVTVLCDTGERYLSTVLFE